MQSTQDFWRAAASVAAGFLFVLPLAMAGILDKIQGNDITPPVKINQGQLTGIYQTSFGGKKYRAFYGIPYAKPPVGDLRFKAPQPAGPWEGVRAAHSEGDMCPQPNEYMKPQGSVKSASDALKIVASLPGAAKYAARYMLHMSEDCLVLNVYTPVDTLPTDKLLPVLVWIHGGSFMYGSGDSEFYGPEHLMDRNVVMVSMNYRLGPFGFLASNSSDAPGNAGLKDQRLALKWVQDNIRSFGGDPDKVTLYGNSAGSVSVHLHVLSPRSKGLFQAAVLSSGAASCFWAIQSDPDGNSRRLAEALKAGPDTVADIKRRIQFLRDAPFKDIVNAVKTMMEMKDEHVLVNILPEWTPVVELADVDEMPFLEKHPYDILTSGEFNTEIPMMIGVNSKEGSLWIAKLEDADYTRLGANPSLFLSPVLYQGMDANSREAASKKIKNIYLKDQEISRDVKNNIADVFGDENLAHGIHLASHWHLKHSKAPIYLYYFTLDGFGVLSFVIGVADLKGAGHSDDVSYVLKNHIISDAGTSEKERVAVGTERMTNFISNFVIDRNPTTSKTELINVMWAPATFEKPVYLDIGENLTLREGVIEPMRMQFWDETTKAVISNSIFDLK